MLVVDLKYKHNGNVYTFKGLADDTVQSSIITLVGQDGASANLLLEGQADRLKTTQRTFVFGKSKLTIDRLFKKGELVVDGVDLSSPKEYAKTDSFKFLLEFFSIYNFAKGISSDTKFVRNTNIMELDTGESMIKSLTNDIFETPKGTGKVTREFGLLLGLTYNSDNFEISIIDSKSYDEGSIWSLRNQLGIFNLASRSNGTAYAVPLTKDKQNEVLGIKTRPSIAFEGLETDTSSVFYGSIAEVLSAHPDKDFRWILDKIKSKNFQIVRQETLDSVMKQLEEDYQQTGYLAYDTETTGLNFTFKCFSGEGSKPVGYIFSAKMGTSYYFPVGHTKIPNLFNGDYNYLVEHYFNPFLKGKKLILHNNAFDYKVSLASGLDYDCYFDTMVFMEKTYKPRDKYESGLKPTTEIFLKRTAPELDDLTRSGNFKTSGGSFADLPEELVLLYACPDADNTLSLFMYFKESGTIDYFNAWGVVENESAFSSVVAYSEFYGMHLDLNDIPELMKVWGDKREKARQKVFDFLKWQLPNYDISNFKLTSSVQKIEIAYKLLNYPAQYNKSGNLSLDKNAVKALSKYTIPDTEPFTVTTEQIINLINSRDDLKGYLTSEGNIDWVNGEQAILQAVKETNKNLGFNTQYTADFRQSTIFVEPEVEAPRYPFAKLLKDFMDAERMFTNFFNKIDEYFTRDGFCFPEINQFLVTGRVSTKKPNVQGFDDNIKQSIRPREGYYIADMDYSSKESRVIAIMSQEKSLLDLFKDPRNDFHRYMAALMNGKLQEQVTNADRGQSKAVNFGVNFGMSLQSLGAHLFGSESPSNTERAKERRELFFSFQPNVEKWFDKNVESAFSKGYTETIFGGRRFYKPGVEKDGSIRRRALNHPIQGSAADIYKAGMVHLFKTIRELGYLGKVLVPAFVHDEAVLEFHKSIHPHVALGLLRQHMMVQLPNACPLYIGFGVGNSWYSAKKTEWQVSLQEKLEWQTEAYNWDGDIEKYYKWSVSKIEEQDAYDAQIALQNEEYQGKVFPVAYGLAVNSYLYAKLGKNAWKTAKPYCPNVTQLDGWEGDFNTHKDVADKLQGELDKGKVKLKNWLTTKGISSAELKRLHRSNSQDENFSDGVTLYDTLLKLSKKIKDENEEANYYENLIKSSVMSQFPTLHIDSRLDMFYKECVKNKEWFVELGVDDLHKRYLDVTEVAETHREQSRIEASELELQRKEKERQMQLVKNQVMDFGSRLDLENKTFVALYSQPLWVKIKGYLVPEKDIAEKDSLAFYVYSMEKDVIKHITGYRLPLDQVSAVNLLLTQYAL